MYLEHGTGRVLPPSDFAVYTNEQYGFTATLADSTNHVFAFALPYPSGINLERETIAIRAIDYNFHDPTPDVGSAQMLDAYMSMLDEEFSATFATLTDADDEEMRAHFDGPITFGTSGAITTDTQTATAEGFAIQYNNDLVKQVRYFPWQSEIDLLTPLYIQLVKHNLTGQAGVENDPVTTGDYIRMEETTIKPIYRVRALTSSERSIRGNQFAWMRLNS